MIPGWFTPNTSKTILAPCTRLCLVLVNEYAKGGSCVVLLFQPPCWHCVECATHHEQDVRKEWHPYMWHEHAITEWSRQVISIVAAVWSFVHLPLRLSSRNKKVLWPGCEACAMATFTKRTWHWCGSLQERGGIAAASYWRWVECAIYHEWDVHKEQYPHTVFF